MSHFAQESTPGLRTPGRKATKNKDIDVFHSTEKKPKEFTLFTKLLESKAFQIAIASFTIYALFADDFRIICTTKSTDNVFNGFTFLCFALFFFEMLLSIIVKKDYIFSFYFWLDLISTFSLIIDITFISDMIL